ncbi:MAG: hypothetical protein QG553_911 [Patescibacteria group bacterium]|nr:hypothetical protein [Patescibacteria group bacterium]
MRQFSYLGFLLFSLAGLAVADWRYKLALFYDVKRTARVLVVGLTVFLVWDLAGIALRIFYTGPSTLVTGILLLPDLPLEEPFFLLLLCYFSLIVWKGLQKWRSI